MLAETFEWNAQSILMHNLGMKFTNIEYLFLQAMLTISAWAKKLSA